MEQFILNLLDAIGNIDFRSVWNVFFYALAIFWMVVLYWIWLDSGDRSSSKKARIAYVLLGLILNIVGLVIYLIIRPSRTIEEIYWSDLERRYLKFETSELGDCPKCGAQLFPGFRFCPECKYKLKIKCPNCNVFIDRKYKYCPQCGEELHRNRSFDPLQSPTKEVMQGQIEASRIEATEVVEGSRTRYSVKKSIATHVGDRVIAGYMIVLDGIKGLFKTKGKEKKESVAKEIVNNSVFKKSKKKNKRKAKR